MLICLHTYNAFHEKISWFGATNAVKDNDEFGNELGRNIVNFGANNSS